MKQISTFLDKFIKLSKTNNDLKIIIKNLIEDSYNIKIPLNKISIKGDTAQIKLSSIVKNKIFLNQKTIISNLELKYKNTTIKKII